MEECDRHIRSQCDVQRRKNNNNVSYIIYFSGHATPTPHGSHQRLAISPNPMQAAHAQVSAHQLTLGHVGNDYDPSVPLQKRFRGPENSHAHSSSEPGHHWTSS